MNSIIQYLNQGWVSVTFSAVFFLASLVVAYLFYRLSIMGPRPVYQKHSLVLISERGLSLPREVTVLYGDKPVPRLTRNQFVMWNAGVTKLEGTDIVAADPLRLEATPGTDILQAVIIKNNNSFCNFQVSAAPGAPNVWLISFDYLNPGEGAVIEILHTDPKSFVQLKGSVRGVRHGVRDWGAISSSESTGWRLLRSLTTAVLAVSLMIQNLTHRDGNPRGWTYVTWLMTTAAFVALIWGEWANRRRYPRSLYTPLLASTDHL